MNQSQTLTAKDIVNKWSEEALGDIFRELGEERHWRAAAKAIVNQRKKQPFSTTTQLAQVVEATLGKGNGKKHVATKIFQGLRMAVNRELDAIREGIVKAMAHLAPSGRLAAISFHSLEDRLVKTLFKEASVPVKKIVGEKEEVIQPFLDLITKKPIIPTPFEVKKNVRARSAKLRAAKKHG